MNKTKELILTISTVLAVVVLPLAGYAQFGRPNTTQVRNIITRLETRTDSFRLELDRALDRTPINSTNREDRITDFINDFESATDSLRQNFDGRRDVRNEVNEVLNRALFINRFMARNRLTARAENSWNAIRNDLNRLSQLYSVSWNWNRIPNYDIAPQPGFGRRGFDEQITGTYRLNRTLSDDINVVLNRVDDSFTVAQRDRMRRNLERRLSSPEMIAIEKNGQSMTMASSLSPQVTFDVDGVARAETTNRGRTIRTTATANRGSVEISYVGDRSNDFYLTLDPTRANQLRVTRRLYLENRNQTVSVSSVYDKINNVAQWSMMNDRSPWNTGSNLPGAFFIPNGTRLTAVLNNLVTTRATQVGDRFTMNVVSPAIYRDAVIEGRIASIDNSGRLSGRANMSLEFDTIRMGTGQTYRFAGVIDSVRAVNGDNVTVTNEGTIRDRNQTTQTVTRAGIGAALGALIGAIAGGGEGAAVGAALGAGAGAGSILIQGRDNVELEQGTQFTITATGPTNVGLIR